MQPNSTGGVVMLACLILIVAVAQVPAVEKADKPLVPKERFAAIVKIQQQAMERYRADLDKAKDVAEQQKEAMDRYHSDVAKNCAAILDLVRENPNDPIVVEALRFVIKTARMGPGTESVQAIDILARNHGSDPTMGEICQEVFYFFLSPAVESLIRSVMKRHPNYEDRGLACHALALHFQYQAYMIRKLRAQPEMVGEYDRFLGSKAATRLLREKNPELLDKEADGLLERVVSEFGAIRYDPQTGGRQGRMLAAIAEGELFALRHLQVGKVAPDIEAKDVEGREFKLSSYRGKVIVLTFSGNWCGPCRGMYPQLRELTKHFKDQPFAIVSVDTDEDKETLRKSIESNEIVWRCWRDGDKTGPITTRWGVREFPKIFVLDANGVIRFKDVRGDDLGKALDTLMAEISPTRSEP